VPMWWAMANALWPMCAKASPAVVAKCIVKISTKQACSTDSQKLLSN